MAGLSPRERLREEYGMRGILTLSPDKGGITDLLCDMDYCYCPRGRGYFDPLSEHLTDWMPSEDHHPKLKMFGGREAGNIRLAHRRCNGLAVGWYRGHVKQRWRTAFVAAQWHKDHWKESEANAAQRGAWEEQWTQMRRARGRSSPEG
jgi:hypothetical protein